MANRHAGGRAVDHDGRAAALEVAVERQHVVGQLGRLGHELVAHHEALERAERVGDLLAARVVEHRVGLHHHGGGDLARLHRVDGGHAARVGEGRRAAGRLAGNRGELLDALRGQRVVVDGGNRVERQAAQLVEVAQHGVDQAHQAPGVEAVLVARAEVAAARHADEARRGALPQLRRDARDLAVGDAGLLAGPRQVVGAHLGGELLEARGVGGQELLVVVAVAHQLGRDADQEGQLGARNDGHPFVSHAADRAHARVDEHELALVGALGVRGGVGRAEPVGARLVEQHRVAEIRAIGRGVRTGADAARGGRYAGVADGRVVVVVGAAQRGDEALGEGRVIAARLQDGGLAAGRLERRADLLEGLVPGDLLELRPVLLQRLGQAVLGIHGRDQALAAAAQMPARVRMPRLARDAPGLAVAHPCHHAALVRAAVAQGVHLLGLGGFGRLGERLIPGAEARVSGASGESSRPRRAGHEAAPGNSLL